MRKKAWTRWGVLMIELFAAAFVGAVFSGLYFYDRGRADKKWEQASYQDEELHGLR